MMPIRVLLVEDNPAHAVMVQEMLASVGDSAFDLEQAGRLSSGLERLGAGDVDAVLLDLCLPDSQGFDTFAKLHARSPDTPIVVLSGLNDKALALKTVQLGAQDYLVKETVDPVMLGRSIRYAIERKRAEEELRQQAAELRLRNEELDAFAHTVAHELQNPLALLVGFAEMLELDCGAIPPEALQKYLRTIAGVGRKMSSVVGELLLLAQVRRMDVQMRPLEMGGVVAAALQRLAHLIHTHEAEVEVADHWPTALGYGPWVEEVWVNYISNAVRYGGRPPHVELGATAQRDGLVSFWVRDNGPGLTPERQATLFTPCTELDHVRVKGHGLGLSIVLRIMNRLGGQVGVQSEVGQGSVFAFRLPRARNERDVELEY